MKQTVGQQINDNLRKSNDFGSVNVIELQHAMQENYIKELRSVIDKDYNNYPQDFYVVVLTKAERILTNTFRNYFFTRHSCPTPFYDQTVFRYNKKAGRIEYLWTVPGKDECVYLAHHASELPTKEQELLSFVRMYVDGTLLKLAKKLNKETQEQGILYKKSEKEIEAQKEITNV
jgi:hypothetical protein